MSETGWTKRLKSRLWQAALFIPVYYGASRLGMPFVVEGSVSPVWPPTGITVAAILLWGVGFSPVVFVASFLTAIPELPFAVAFGFSVEKVTEALAAFYLMQRGGFDGSLESVRSVWAFLLGGAVAACAIGAVAGVASLCLWGGAPWSEFWNLWLVWWLGDAMGVVVFVPVVLVFANPPKWSWDGSAVMAAVVLTLALLATAELAFGGYLFPASVNMPLAYLPFSIVFWATLRFGFHGAALSSFVLSVRSIAGSLQGVGPFARESSLESLLLLEAYLAVVVLTALILGAVIAERRSAAYALLDSQERYERASSAGIVGLWDWKVRTGDLFVDPALKSSLGFKDWEIANTIEAWSQRIPPDDLELIREATRRHFEGVAERLEVEHRMMHKDGSSRWFLTRGAAVRDQEGAPIRVIGTDVDITAHKLNQEALQRSESSLRESHRKIQVLATRIMAAQEDERRRVSRELHDGLNQDLSALSFEIGRLRSEIPQEASALRFELTSLQDRASQLIESARRLSHELHPSMLEHLGLVAALQGYCDEMTAQGAIRVQFDVVEPLEPLETEAALCLFRVAQEGLRNAAKHSGAEEVLVTLTSDSKSVALDIADDGTGFDTTEGSRLAGLGLVSMAERVRAIGGAFRLASEPDAGTRLEVRLPLPVTRAS